MTSVDFDNRFGREHVDCEKPLARTLREADEMIAACSGAGVKLMYAEELCFAPKYVLAKQLADEGALGQVYLVRQSEQHSGPHSDWFWDPELAGGGVLMDMGCHGMSSPAGCTGSHRPGQFPRRSAPSSTTNARWPTIMPSSPSGSRVGGYA
jgi:predicted dehydrogenase